MTDSESADWRRVWASIDAIARHVPECDEEFGRVDPRAIRSASAAARWLERSARTHAPDDVFQFDGGLMFEWGDSRFLVLRADFAPDGTTRFALSGGERRGVAFFPLVVPEEYYDEAQ